MKEWWHVARYTECCVFFQTAKEILSREKQILVEGIYLHMQKIRKEKHVRRHISHGNIFVQLRKKNIKWKKYH